MTLFWAGTTLSTILGPSSAHMLQMSCYQTGETTTYTILDGPEGSSCDYQFLNTSVSNRSDSSPVTTSGVTAGVLGLSGSLFDFGVICLFTFVL